MLYTGDFRSHGDEAALVQRMIAKPPPVIDVLVMEGTNWRNNNPEAEIEHRIAAPRGELPGYLFTG